ncbi:hypothetical protein [Pseudomonas sp. 2FE]|uniref:hypothetical protein n=1 Tax=Pseudomonas sp. 2FE TaxID=2502190 RepID=UPI0010F5C7E9|nr:hypothetical protein [Pseudomonas sp. 2FE]
MEFNNREIAAVIWIATVIVAASFKSEIRNSLTSLAGAFFKKPIVISVALAALWISFCVWFLSDIGLWDFSNLKTTLVWGVAFAFVTMMDISRISDDSTYFKETIRDTINMTAVVTFIAEAYSFSLLVELIILPLISIVAMMQAIASRSEEHVKVQKFCTGILTSAGIIYLGYGLSSAMTDFGGFATTENLLEFTAPIMLSLLFLPFIYLMSAFVTYENRFLGLRYSIKDKSLIRYSKLKAIFSFGFNLESLRRWVREIQLRHPTNRAEINKTISEIKHRRKIEKSPPEVDLNEGWSPYAAKDFLSDIGLKTRDYHHSYNNEWTASSNMLELSNGLLPDNIAYYVEGNEKSAKLLKLKLNINNSASAADSDSLFKDTCYILLNKALGEVPVNMIESIENLESCLAIFEQYKLSISFDEFAGGAKKGYSRKLVIAHLGADNPSLGENGPDLFPTA